MDIRKQNNSSERLFAELCNVTYLKGFVFHSPKYGEQLQYEAGDVVLWLRSQLIVFEIVWRNTELAESPSTKSFVKRIGEKRKQLIKDYENYDTIPEQIKMTDENGETIEMTDENFIAENFCGVIIIDSEEKLDKLNFLQYKKTLENNFPISIFTKADFNFLISEADTIPDLLYYFKDRYEFLKLIFEQDYGKFLDTESKIEKDLIAIYKMNNYEFPLDIWNKNTEKNFWEIMQLDYKEQIIARDKQNKDSFIIDELLDYIRNHNDQNNNTILHSWELAILPRRSRAQEFATKIVDAISRLQDGNEFRYVSFLNQTTECWSLFIFQYGGEMETFSEIVRKYCQLKLFYEMNHNNFRYSVFGYGFRKSNIETDNTFDQIILWIEDADKYTELDIEKLKEANRYFGNIKVSEIKEFPDEES